MRKSELGVLDVLFQHRHRVFLLLHVEMCLGFDVDDSKVCVHAFVYVC